MTTTKTTTTTKTLARSTVTPRPKATAAKKAAPKKATTKSKVDPNAASTLAATRIERLARAKDEAKVLKAWQTHGENGARPATPNLDAIGEGKASPAKGAIKKPTVRSTRNARYNEALELKRKGPRGKGKPVTDAGLTAHIVAVRNERTDTTMQQECEIAYWLHGMSVTWHRFNPMWDDIVNGKTAVAPKSKDTVKAAA